jgi:MtN3 and saliva related transmembrane protein
MGPALIGRFEGREAFVITLIGTVAAILTTVCWLPQVIKTTRTREAGDFHWLYLAMLGVGIAAWFTYGVLQHDAPIYLANGITLCLVAVIAIVKARQGAGVSELGTR